MPGRPEDNGRNGTSVGQEHSQALLRHDIPLGQESIQTAGIGMFAIRRDGTGGDGFLARLKTANRVSFLCFPQTQMAIPAPGKDETAVRRVGTSSEFTTVAPCRGTGIEQSQFVHLVLSWRQPNNNPAFRRE